MATSCPTNDALNPVELGFAEKRTPWKLRSKFFPSKIGGAPAWLNLKDLPSVSELECPTCKKLCVFLLQVYAPFDTEETFHRTVFIFMCKDGRCCKKNSNQNFVILRNQLARANDFYSFEPPIGKERDSHIPSAEQHGLICDVCGCRGTLQCSNCKVRKYCSAEHQSIDWKDGHKDACSTENAQNGKRVKKNSSFLLSEFDLVIDTESLPAETPEKSDDVKMKEYQQFMKSTKAPANSDDIAVGEIESVARKSDKMFRKFQKRVNYEPEQVLRYDRHGEPLWVSSENIPSEKDILPCRCGAKRLFEFQVMPQLLNYLSLDSDKDSSVDWGTLTVYTCANSCSLGNSGYVPEFLWKQDYSDE